MTTVMHNQSAEDYHASPGASASRLKQLKQRSAAHMKYDMENPQEPTPAMTIGSAAHSAILEPGLFLGEWGRIPEGDGRSKAVKEAKAELAGRYGADHILKPDVYDNILAMRDSVLGNAGGGGGAGCGRGQKRLVSSAQQAGSAVGRASSRRSGQRTEWAARLA